MKPNAHPGEGSNGQNNHAWEESQVLALQERVGLIQEGAPT